MHRHTIFFLLFLDHVVLRCGAPHFPQKSRSVSGYLLEYLPSSVFVLISLTLRLLFRWETSSWTRSNIARSIIAGWFSGWKNNRPGKVRLVDENGIKNIYDAAKTVGITSCGLFLLLWTPPCEPKFRPVLRFCRKGRENTWQAGLERDLGRFWTGLAEKGFSKKSA